MTQNDTDMLSFGTRLKPYGALLGIDFGTKRIGLAVSDVLRLVATSYKILERRDINKDIEALEQVIADKEICAIVYGLPKQMNGIEGETAIAVRKFALDVAEKINLPYVFWDERLSSKAVESFLIKEVDMSRQKRKKILDASAAAYILQGALDALQNIKKQKQPENKKTYSL